jgi:hypothetical protein
MYSGTSHFCPEDGGSMFLQNSDSYLKSKPRKKSKYQSFPATISPIKEIAGHLE